MKRIIPLLVKYSTVNLFYVGTICYLYKYQYRKELR